MANGSRCVCSSPNPDGINVGRRNVGGVNDGGGNDVVPYGLYEKDDNLIRANARQPVRETMFRNWVETNARFSNQYD